MRRLIAILITVVSIPAFGGNEFEDLNDNALLDLAAKQVMRMSSLELDALSDFISSCESLASSEVRAFYCEKDLSRFLMRFGSNRAIDTLAGRMRSSSELIDALSTAKKRSEAADLIERRRHIFKTIKAAVNQQYMALKGSQQRQ